MKFTGPGAGVGAGAMCSVKYAVCSVVASTGEDLTVEVQFLTSFYH